MNITQLIAFQPLEFCLFLGYWALLLSGVEVRRRFFYAWIGVAVFSLGSLAYLPPGYSFQAVVVVSALMSLLISVELGLGAFSWAVVFGGLIALLAPRMELPFFVSWSALFSTTWACFTICELRLERSEAGYGISQHGFLILILSAGAGAFTSFLPNAFVWTVFLLGFAFVGLGRYCTMKHESQGK